MIMNQELICPLIRRLCIKTKCQFYSERLTNCHISLLAYNIYKLSEVEAALLRIKTEKDQPVSENVEKLDLDPAPIEGLG